MAVWFLCLCILGSKASKCRYPLAVEYERDEAALSKSFMNGFLMSLFNPLSIMFWLGIYGSILAKAVNDSTVEQTLINSGAVILGILIWDIFMATAASLFRKYLTLGVLKGISIISGLSCRFWMLFWSESRSVLFFI